MCQSAIINGSMCSPPPPAELTLDEAPSYDRCDAAPVVLGDSESYLAEIISVIECICVSNQTEDTTLPHGVPTIEEYVRRLQTSAKCSSAMWLLTMFYLMKLTRHEYELNYRTAHYLILTCFVTAAKMHDDQRLPYKTYAFMGGVTAQELMSLEGCVLTALDWKLSVDRSELRGLQELLANWKLGRHDAI
eukprot:Rhum_TRINITY_DN4600_c0_g1::Rhum_TRINITY_DN4600_c0_g1_i1::g.15131::m.15131